MRQRILFVAAIIAAGGIAACSSGASVTPPSYSGGGGSTGPTGTSFINATVGATAIAVTLPPVTGVTATVTIPAGSGSIQIESSVVNPGGVVNVQSLRQSLTGHTPLFYLTILARSAVTLSTTPGFSLTFATAPTGTLYESEAVVSGGYSYWGTVGSLLTASGNSVAVPALPGTVTLTTGQSLYLAVYSGGVLPTPAARPATVGNTFAYGGTETNTGTYTYPSINPSISPGPASSMPPTAGTAAVTTNITVQAAPTPFFTTTASVVDVHSVETDAFALRSNVTTTDAWFGTSASAYSLYGSSSNDGAGDSFTTAFTAPQVVDEIPEVAGSWTNSPAATLTESDSDGTSSTRTIAAGGTYTETQTIPDGYALTITTNADGSGSYGGTAFSAFHGRSAFVYSAPAAGVVTVSVQPTPQGASPAPSPLVVATPAAFFSPAPALYNESDVLSTNVPFSNNAACAVPTQFGASGNEVFQTIGRIDPVLGYTESETIATYSSPGIGPVCIVLFDSQSYYYNYNNDDGRITSYSAVFGNGSLKSVLTSSEVLNLSATNAIVPTGVVRRTQSASQAGALAPSTIAFARASFDAQLERTRRNQANALRTFITHVMSNLGVTQ